MTISIAEYQALQDQARELQRLLARRGEFQERGNAPEERDGRPRGDFRERSDMREGSGPLAPSTDDGGLTVSPRGPFLMRFLIGSCRFIGSADPAGKAEVIGPSQKSRAPVKERWHSPPQIDGGGSMPVRKRTLLTRRSFLTTAASAAAASVVGGIAKPYLSRAADRPLITHGIQSGDVSIDSGVVWARTDRPARMLVEAATTDSFNDIHSAVAIDALPESDFTAKALIEDLPAGQDIFYRVRFEDLAAPTIIERGAGRPFPHRAEPPALGLVRLVGRHRRARAGASTRRAAACAPTRPCCSNRPDFFIHSGDSIYADCPIRADIEAAERRNLAQHRHRGEVARRAVRSPTTAATTNTICSTRNLRRFNAEVPTFAQWDDHEVANDWWPGQIRADYANANASLLAARGRRAFCEYMPMRQTLAETGRIYRKISYGPLLDVFLLDMRSYRGPNDHGTDATFGPACQILGPGADANGSSASSRARPRPGR